MSASPESTRSRLIREMARDMNRLRTGTTHSRNTRSVANHDTTGSSFDPENEAVASTRQIDEPQRRLPDLRDSAKKYRHPRALEPELQINTSAIHRAFPDFSQGYSSSEDSISIERGRGQPVVNHDLASEYSLTDVRTTKGRPSSSHQQATTPEKASLHRHHPLSHRNAPPAADIYSKNAKNVTLPSRPAPLPFSNANDLMQHLSATKPRQSNARTTEVRQPRQEANSGMLLSKDITDVPNLSELVSGVFEDGTPVFSVGPSRSERQLPNQRKSRLSHAELASIPTPDEEQAIYISLKLLQEKIADLEASKVDDVAAISALRAENEALIREKSERQRSKRSDSALGSTSGSDGGDEAGIGARTAAIERSRLESRLQRVQEELKLANSKAAVSSETIRAITQERDSATNQLGVAYVTTERLKAQIKTLIDEIEQLKARTPAEILSEATKKRRVDDSNGPLATFSRTDTYNRTVEDEDEDNTELLDFDLNVSRHRPMRHDVVPQQEKLARSVPRTNGSQSRQRSSSGRGFEPGLQRKSSDSQPRDGPARRRIPPRDMSRASHAERILASGPGKLGEHSNAQKSRIVLENYSESEKTDASIRQNASVQSKLPKGLRATEFRSGSIGIVQEDLTILSGESGDSIELYPELRGILEQAREEKRNRGWTRITEPQTATHEDNRARDMPPPALQKKSSVKELSKRLSMQTNAMNPDTRDNLTGHSKASSHARRHSSDNSMLEQRSRREGFAMEDMTSAYIVPDITIGAAAARAAPKADTTQPSGGMIDRHTKNCTICHRILEHGQVHTHRSSAKTSIPKPVPVSERMPSPSPSNEEPTMRPSEAPGLSLARVIKALNDEIRVLKEKLRVLERASYQEDPGLSKRQRVERERNIAMLRKAKNRKSDQVYYLMNVLEGQKVAGQEMTEEQVEVTLDNIGIDATQLDLDVRDSGAGEGAIEDFEDEDAENQAAYELAMPAASKPLKSALKKPALHPWDNLDDTEDLPWEGFETTEDVTGRSGRSAGSLRHARVS